MSDGSLKFARRVAALIFFTLMAAIFCNGIVNIFSENAIDCIANLNLASATISLFSRPNFYVVGVLVFFTILTLCFGRIYCSTLCPLGVLMDICAFVLKPWRKKSSFKKGGKVFHFTLAVLAICLLCVGFAGVFGFLEPFSLFGKIWTSIFTTPLEFFRNFYGTNIHASTQRSFNFSAWLVGLILFCALVFFVLRRGRIFCNTLCPVGAYLRLLAKFSVFKFRMDTNACVSCKKCEKQCKAEAIDSKNFHIDSSKCVSCFNCLNSCNKGAITFSTAQKEGKKSEQNADSSRRNFPRNMLLLGAAFCVAAKKESEKSAPLALPAGVKDASNFASLCTSCQLCVNACPSGVLTPAITQRGLSGFMQPYLDFNKSYCIYNCVDCSLICPTGAILPISKKQKCEIKIGTAKLDPELCINVSQDGKCNECESICPVNAITLINYKKNAAIPDISEPLCVGCGACQHVCPTQPKAINIEALHTHLHNKDMVSNA